MSREASMQIIKKIVIDVLLIGILLFGLYVTTAIWVPFKRGFFCGDESLMYPYRDDTVTTPMLKSYGLILPALAFLICEYVLLRKEDNYLQFFNWRIPAWLRGFYLVLVSFSAGVCFMELTTNITKNIIGRPRPHFFNLCKPSIDCSLPEFSRRYIEADEYTCLGENVEKISDVNLSFVSGHSTWAAFTMIYLALYLEKRVTYQGTRVLRHSLQYAAVMLSWFTALSRVSDYKHHWSDVLVGYLLGLVFAVVVWTWGTDILEVKKKHKQISQQDTSVPMQQMALPA
uniref:Wunen3 n=1 Tax=Heliconius melpomene TaxID=34740 RepID=A0A517BDZ1_HELME|nr:wunen3 [Heliconius melpomene]